MIPDNARPKTVTRCQDVIRAPDGVLQEPWRQAHLAELTQQLCRGLGVQSHSPIVPLLVGSEAQCSGSVCRPAQAWLLRTCCAATHCTAWHLPVRRLTLQNMRL